MPVSTPVREGVEGEIVEALVEAKRSLARANDCSLDRIIAAFEKHSKVDISPNKDLQDEICEMFYGKSLVKQAIKEIGHLQFKANASAPEEASDFLSEDARRVNALARASEGERPLEVRKLWEGRRELFMLRNLKEALTKGRKPLLITMGADHARNQKSKIEALVGADNLVIGNITSLAALGTRS